MGPIDPGSLRDRSWSGIERLHGEAGCLLVTPHKGLDLASGHDVVDVVEVATASFIDLTEDRDRTVTAVAQNERRDLVVELVLVGRKRIRVDAVSHELRAEHAGIDDGLTRPVGSHGIHHVGGVTDERHAAIEPGRCRIAIDHRKFPHGFGTSDEGRHVEPVPHPIGEVRQECRRIDLAVPASDRVPFLLRVEGHLEQPVLLLKAGGRVDRSDRIVDKALVEIADKRERRSGSDRGSGGRSAPEHCPSPPWSAFGRQELAPRR